MIPLLFDFTGQTVLVFGGGSVGARKARQFGREARVLVVSPRFDADGYCGADLIRAEPDAHAIPHWLERVEPTLVVAATDEPALNATIERVAAHHGRLVNRVDTSDVGANTGVAMPAIARDGEVVVGVGTGGQSPTLAAALRDRVAEDIAGAGAMASLVADLREDLVAAGVPAQTRRDALRRVVRDSRVWTALDSGGSNPRQIATDAIGDVIGDTP